MTVAAIGIYAAYLVIAFGVRTVIQVRRTGDSGWRGLSGRAGSSEWWAGILFIVALVIGITAPLAAVGRLAPVGVLDHGATRAAGLVVAVAGIALTVAAQLRMGSEWRIGVDDTERTELVTTGLFAVVRNPIFTAMAITGLGLTLMVPNFVAVSGLVALVVALELQVRIVEEPYLRRLHGRSYAAYEASVGRFVPALGTASIRPDRPGSAAAPALSPADSTNPGDPSPGPHLPAGPPAS